MSCVSSAANSYASDSKKFKVKSLLHTILRKTRNEKIKLNKAVAIYNVLTISSKKGDFIVGDEHEWERDKFE